MGKDGLRRRGRIWHLDSSFRRHRIRQSCETEDRNQALSMLRQRQAELDQRGPPALRTPKLTFTDLARDFITDYRVIGKRSVGKAEKSVAHLAQYFGGYRAVNITTHDVRAYIETRQHAGLANGTINRELAALKRMFQLGTSARLLSADHIPNIPMLKEAPPRAGFFEAEQFKAVLRYLRPEIKPVALFAHETGWRLREVITLEWRQ